MATDKLPSRPAWVAYGNAKLQDAARADFKKNAAKMGYPGKDEIGIVDETTLDISHTLAAIPETISGYMHDEKRAFEIPAPDKKTAPATLKVIAVEKKTTTGVQTFGPNKGKSYSSTVAAHEELKVSNNRKAFKTSK